MVKDLSTQNSVFNQFISELRDENIQSDRMRFRRNMERVGEVMAYEISKTFEYEEKEIISPLGEAHLQLLQEKPVLATILRAGLPMHQGFLNYFDDADNCFISAFRKYHKGGKFEIEVEYVSCPDLQDRIVILCDPMIATGASMHLVYQALRRFGEPKKVHVACAIASVQGINFLKQKMSKNVQIWAGAIDSELTAQAYIVPGLGDAGDLSYGSKEH